jgi:hypothetical protein
MQEMTKGMKIKPKDPQEPCAQCEKWKGQRNPFPRESKSGASRELELVHIDTIGPIKPATKGGNRYIFQMTDDYTQFNSIQFIPEHTDLSTRNGIRLEQVGDKNTRERTQR